tara:strand:- start:295 stop:1179 length:885 start_codon:yes stop_codon:yes gene_type:complete
MNRGTQYEIDLWKKYSSIGLVPKEFRPAGGGAGVDFMLRIKNQSANIELKRPGSVSGRLDYGQAAVLQDATGAWRFSDKNQEKEAIVLRQILQNAGILGIINEKWNKLSRTEQLKRQKRAKTALAHATDMKKFKDIFLIDGKLGRFQTIPSENFTALDSGKLSNAINAYYEAKGANYIQISGYGMYSLGKSDPLGLNLPVFNPPVVTCRVRFKPNKTYRGPMHPQVLTGEKQESIGAYTFTTSLDAVGLSPSPIKQITEYVEKEEKNLKFMVGSSLRLDLDDPAFFKFLQFLNQ